MSGSSSSSAHSIRPTSGGGPSAMLCVVGFVVAAGLVFWQGNAAGVPSKPIEQHTATARIFRQIGLPPGVAENDLAAARLADLCRPTSKQVAAKIASDAFLNRVAERINLPNVSTIRKNLQVTAEESTTPGTLEVAITYTDFDPDRGIRLVNRLAESYEADFRGRWQQRTRELCEEAGEATRKARETLLETQRKRDALALQVEQLPPPTPEPSTVVAPAAPEPSRVTEEAPAMVDNPEWLEMHGRLVELESHRDTLLIKRTELHPAVQDVQMRIDELAERILAIPKLIPGPTVDPPVRSAPHPREDLAKQAIEDHAAWQLAQQRRTEWLRKLKDLERSTRQAAEAYQVAEQEERQTWGAGQTAPRIELDLARRGELSVPRRTGLTVLLATLLAGVAGAAGMGMVSLGWAIEPTIGTVDQAAKITSVPVVGVVSESGQTSDRPDAGDGKQWLRPILILGGLVVFGGCLAMAIDLL